MPPSLFWPKALRGALVAAEYGLPVFPLASSKLPALRSPHPGEACRGECGRIGHGVHDASTDPARVQLLFKSAPRATGYGIACGMPHVHLVGVDLDRKNGVDGVAALEQLAVRHEFSLPPTTTVHTPSGGLHLYLKAPGDALVPNSVSRLGPGIDIRGTGGYLAGPGSWSPRGTYQLASRASAGIQPAPSALLKLLAAEASPARQPTSLPPPRVEGEAGDALATFVRESPEGQLNNRLFWAACRAFEQPRDAEACADALLAAACAAGHPERGAARTIASARARTSGGRSNR
ncbi:DNA primase [Streptomyces lunaelactis]|uniref:DNA primase n=1 Tax=Streptomyces lunaelactis TaxID=1535768 RepID=A0A2R4T4D7_9ACTN|nr:bifunctional DNA primase/polymerase [Streptomyces lunaelactis]AVZ74019.1 DNA primase [Streptomyces lunaelactis]NUK85175.1 bifunctional DNA primase/polymerase [Streptomyces lunaelactis]